MDELIGSGLQDILAKLEADTPPLWGRMNAQQMVEHLTSAVRMSTGAIPVKVYTPADKLEKAKSGLLGDRPLPQGYRAPFLPPDPLPVAFADLPEARAALLGALADFHDFYGEKEEAFTLPHPVFGPLNYEEWIVFHNKHFQHHLSQFGLVERIDAG